MNSLNFVTMEGFTTNDPILKHTKTGKNVCTFALTVRHHSESGGDQKVSFIDIDSCGSLADFCSQNVHKGIRLLVNGSMKQDRWDGDDGKIKSRIKLVAKEIRFLDSNKSAKSAEN